MSVRVALIVGSLREGSYSRAIGLEMKALAAPELELDLIEIGDLPLYNPDLDTETPPAAWSRFREELATTQAVLFVTPEYNRSIPGALKNALDVGSRPYGQSVWAAKPAAIVSVSPGALAAFGANHHLRQPLVFLNMPTMQQPEAYIGNVAGLLNEEDGTLKNEGTREFLKGFLNAFAGWIERTKG
ncbi:MAG: NAD(P)H-dependent oxidoreductase [Alphaproteobacteria bacterium]|uniref:NADPH-dependent FMN reductase n=1 Tax=Brevundimonas sp. TaxID=1871086 RepID=UPI001DC1481B|nr:NAD(P)H-dependent oxidoreductase [Alphaproteobacteria bacterium]MBU1522219.1 NAD(P)H-dependent oxidoreductase [Alphaproteobacteria bacterium]MBU2030118.1 NAD(P)H-dependent oxidoreductase [Alphaproteobacteria bacterium]MBU2163168.1 NAD(P)H-dependent oxidoreductase [Alphaproteobacteria bacterium]MBU2231355.1 NAD(P)H-dependent oxidoreductase [Alphaproteobacteria bacterium]